MTVVGLALSTPADAHPHAWIKVKLQFEFVGSALSGIRQQWTFDPIYTLQTLTQLGLLSTGEASVEGLRKLADVSANGLKDVDYFSTVTVAGQAVPVDPIRDYALQVVEGGSDRSASALSQSLRFSFLLPLSQPIPIGPPEITINVYDPSFFYWFDLEEAEPVSLVGAPPTCRFSVEAATLDVAALALIPDLADTLRSSFGPIRTIKLAC
jgi:ABC-type uncharacterized transport system substrate-binding protein